MLDGTQTHDSTDGAVRPAVIQLVCNRQENHVAGNEWARAR